MMAYVAAPRGGSVESNFKEQFAMIRKCPSEERGAKRRRVDFQPTFPSKGHSPPPSSAGTPDPADDGDLTVITSDGVEFRVQSSTMFWAR